MNKQFSIKELAKLIKICKDNSVSCLKIEGIELVFSATENPLKTPSPQARGSAKKAEIVEEKSLLQEQFNFAQESIEALHIEDPTAFEALMFERELGEKEKN